MNRTILAFIVFCAVMTVIILLLIAFFALFGKKITSESKYAAWKTVIIQLCIPLPLIVFLLQNPFSGIEATHLVRMPDIVSDTYSVINKAEEGMPFASGQYAVFEKAAEYNLRNSEFENEFSKEAEIYKSTDNLIAKYGVNYTNAALILWAAGAIAVFLKGVTGYLSFTLEIRKQKKRGLILEAQEGDALMYNELCEEMAIKKAPKLYFTESPTIPVLFGFFGRKIIMPSSEMSSDEKKAVLRHELIHHKRHDLIMKLLCLFAKSIYWFDPAVSLAVKALEKEEELSCDEALLSDKSEDYRIMYCETVLAVLKRFKKAKPLSVGFVSHSSARDRKKRFENILDTTKKKSAKALTVLTVVVCVICFCSAGGTSFSAPWGIIIDEKKVSEKLKNEDYMYMIDENRGDYITYVVSDDGMVYKMTGGIYLDEENTHIMLWKPKEDTVIIDAEQLSEEEYSRLTMLCERITGDYLNHNIYYLYPPHWVTIYSGGFVLNQYYPFYSLDDYLVPGKCYRIPETDIIMDNIYNILTGCFD